MKLNALISIKPKFVREILSGKKKYEYRKSIFKKEIDKIYIYSTNPEKKIVGYFKYNGYIKNTPLEVWRNTKEISGIDEESYYEYFNGKSYAYAIKIDKVYVFRKPIDPNDVFDKFVAPQSYKYLEGDIY